MVHTMYSVNEITSYRSTYLWSVRNVIHDTHHCTDAGTWVQQHNGDYRHQSGSDKIVVPKTSIATWISDPHWRRYSVWMCMLSVAAVIHWNR